MAKKYGVYMLALVLTLALLLGGAQVAPAPAAESPADFYANNITTLVVPFGAGGGVDFVARLLAAFWPDAMGGNARVKNMHGGDTILATNFVWKAKPDGLTLEVAPFATSLTTKALLKPEGVKFDISKFNYIGIIGNDPWVLGMRAKGPYTSLEALLKAKGKVIKLATSGKTGSTAIGAALILELLGLTDGKVISGYNTTPQMGLAIARGEVDGFVFPAEAVSAEFQRGYVVPIVTVGYRKSVLWSDVSPLSEAMQLSAEQDGLLRLFYNTFPSGKVLIGPPGMDQEKVKFLRDSLIKMGELKGFRKHYKARAGVFEPPMPGKDVAKMVQELLGVSQADVDVLLQLVNKYVK